MERLDSSAGVSPTQDPEATVSLMARIGACVSPSFSPDGATLAFVSDLGGVPQVWTVPVAGGWPMAVTALDDPVQGVSWSPRGDWLAFSLAPGGGMNAQVYLVRPDGAGLRLLTDGGTDNNRLGPWTHDGHALLIGSNRRDPAAIDAYLYDVESGVLRLVARNDGIGSATDVSRDGRRALLDRVVGRGDSNLFLVDLESGEDMLLTPHEGAGVYAEGRFAPDGRSAYLISDEGRDYAALARIALPEGGRPGAVEMVAVRDDAELREFVLSKDGATAVLLWNRAGRAEFATVDLPSGHDAPGPALLADVAFGLTLSRDDRLLAVATTGATAPCDIVVSDRLDGRAWRATRSPHAGVDLDGLSPAELVSFSAHDGSALTGWLYQPRSGGSVSGPGPLVLSFHGGPEAQERPTFNATYQALLAYGVAVFAPNVRGSSGFGKTFLHLDDGPLRVDAVRDIKACVDYVVDAGITDAGRIGIMGGSYGGYMTMAGLTEHPDLFAAGANLFGIVNFETFFAHTEPWMAAISTTEYGDPGTPEGRDLLRRLSPIHRLDRVAAPVLVLHGANDTNVPVVEAEQVVEGLRGRGVPVEYILFPDEGHGFVKAPNRVRAAIAIVNWFARHLKGRPTEMR